MSAVTGHDGPSRHDRRAAADYERAHVAQGAQLTPITAEEVEWFDRLTPSQLDVLYQHLVEATAPAVGRARTPHAEAADPEAGPPSGTPVRRTLGERVLDVVGRIVDALAAGSVAGAVAAGLVTAAPTPYAEDRVIYPFFWWYGYWAGTTQAWEDPRYSRKDSDEPPS
ncbi:hypothetical protein [Microbacterium kyungheense]|uniref:Uncharacterized protein n=1 Tax=Microbacterium kyungheense TaxID=1263636 RepID=A0A543EFE0_9MICO|nr:hypothetical protein [Microbacterium kyungheense]TQM20297.1 hypothetical protein FB391_3433 [Microbacterium kyungheense]